MDDADRKLIASLTGLAPGRRVQFHPNYCPEAKGTHCREWDSSHDMSVIRPDGTRYRIATYRHADDACLSQAAPDLHRIVTEQATEIAQARAALVSIRDHAPMGTHAYITANAAIGRLK